MTDSLLFQKGTAAWQRNWQKCHQVGEDNRKGYDSTFWFGEDTLPRESRGGMEGSSLIHASCPLCNKKFFGYNRKFLLTRHLITHTGEKPYQCRYCPYRANVSSNLSRHVKTVHAQIASQTQEKLSSQGCENE